MTPDVVVDVGNTRIKWGRCSGGRVADTAALPPDTPSAWSRQAEAWGLPAAASWAVSGVHPAHCESLVRWLRGRGPSVWHIEGPRQLPLVVRLEHPERVGIDRLLNAVAATRGERRRVPAILVDAGSAVTVDWVDEAGAFRGGSIFPGLRLMAQALRDHTALLPLVAVSEPCPALPGLSTTQAIAAGVYCAVAGGINTLIGRLLAGSGTPSHVYLTGGDAGLLRPGVEGRAEWWPEMTLEGIRLSAEAQP